MSPTEVVSRLQLEQLVLGRLDPEQRAALDLRVAEDPDLQARLERLRADISAADVDLPPLVLPSDPSVVAAPEAAPSELASVHLLSPESVPATAPSPAPERRGGRRSWPWALAGLAVAAAATLAIVPGGATEGPAGTRGGTEVFRGSFDLEVHRVRAGASQPVGALVEARAGDTLQYTVTPAADGWWMVAGVQDDGAVSMWTPPRRVKAGVGATAAAQLDDYAGAERAYFLLSDAPMELDVVRAAYAAAYRSPLAELDSLPGLPGDQRSVLIVRSPASP